MQGVRKARKKPIDIEYMVLQGEPGDWMEVYQWIEVNTDGSFEPMDVIEGRVPCPASGVSIDPRDGRLMIATLEGFHHANLGDVIIRGIKGEFYPCKPDIFAGSYDPIAAPGNYGSPVSGATTFPPPRPVRDNPQA